MDPRREIWSDREINSLVEYIRIYKDVVYRANSKSVSRAFKRATWERIKNNIHADNPSSPERPVAAVRKKWENLLGAARKDIELKKKSLSSKGEGPPFFLRPIYNKIWFDILGTENSTLSATTIENSTATHNDEAETESLIQPALSTTSDHSNCQHVEEPTHIDVLVHDDPSGTSQQSETPPQQPTMDRKRKNAFFTIWEQEERERLKTEEQRQKTEEQRLKTEEQRLKTENARNTNNHLEFERHVRKIQMVRDLLKTDEDNLHLHNVYNKLIVDL